jgi:hypothetical protein
MLRAIMIGGIIVMLAGCGGGGGNSESACSSQVSLNITVQWNSNGSIANTVSGKVGTPLTATPIVTGIPASCVGQESYSTGAPGLPAGLTLNAHTGVISGTPTQGIGIGGSGLVSLKLPGYSQIGILDIINIAP